MLSGIVDQVANEPIQLPFASPNPRLLDRGQLERHPHLVDPAGQVSADQFGQIHAGRRDALIGVQPGNRQQVVPTGQNARNELIVDALTQLR